MYRLFILSPAFLLLTIAALLSSFSSSMLMQKDVNIFAQENLIAWCIVPYDSKQRTPQQRIEMLKKLNFSQYAYDWRHEHLSSLPEEIQLAKQNNIRMAAVWMWIDKETDRAGKLSMDNEKLLEIIREAGIQVQLWVGFNSNFYDQATEKEKIGRGAEMIQYLRKRTKPLGCTIALYNHGDWFGEPDNQIKILKQLKDKEIGLIYNFHHAHEQIEAFPALLERMKPWLGTVNLNGMRKEGPKILPIGSGNQELGMIKIVQASGFKGSIGILGHVEDEDVELVLQRNLDGLKKLVAAIK